MTIVETDLPGVFLVEPDGPGPAWLFCAALRRGNTRSAVMIWSIGQSSFTNWKKFTRCATAVNIFQ